MFDSSLVDGDSVRVFCTLQHGSQPVSFQWHKDGHPLPVSLNDRIAIQNHNDYSSLIIDKVSRNFDNGNYTCSATNSHGHDTVSSMLIVQGKNRLDYNYIKISFVSVIRVVKSLI